MSAFKKGDRVRVKPGPRPFWGTFGVVRMVRGEKIKLTLLFPREITYRAAELELVEAAAQEKQP